MPRTPGPCGEVFPQPRRLGCEALRLLCFENILKTLGYPNNMNKTFLFVPKRWKDSSLSGTCSPGEPPLSPAKAPCTPFRQDLPTQTPPCWGRRVAAPPTTPGGSKGLRAPQDRGRGQAWSPAAPSTPAPPGPPPYPPNACPCFLPPSRPAAPTSEAAQEEGKWGPGARPPRHLQPFCPRVPPPKDVQCALGLTFPLSSRRPRARRPSTCRSP